jgi:hypothetical protein
LTIPTLSGVTEVLYPAGYLLLRQRYALNCLQNNGSLSKAKRQLPEYAVLSNQEIAGLEAAVVEAFALKS